MWVVVPCKRLHLAKRRLASALTERECRCLVSAMLSDVLAAISRASGIDGILVASSDPAVADLARAFGARCVSDNGNEGLLSACAGASALLSSEGAGGVITLPGDLPLLGSNDVGRVVDSLTTFPAVVLAPDRNDSGTNLVAMKPAGLMPYLFGENSFPRHIAAARQCGIEPVIIRSPNLGLDIDTRDDLIAFAQSPSWNRTFDYLIETGIRDRLLRTRENDPLRVNAGQG